MDHAQESQQHWDKMNEESEIRADFEHKYRAYWRNHLEHDRAFFYDKIAEAYNADKIFDAYDLADPKDFYQSVVDFITPYIDDEVKFQVQKAMDSWSIDDMNRWMYGPRVVEEDKQDVITLVRL